MGPGSPRAPQRVVNLVRNAPEDTRAPYLPWLAAALVAYAGGLTTLTVTKPLGDYSFTVVTDLAGLLPPFIAAAFAFAAAARSNKQVRSGWLLLGAGCLAWGFGEGAWSYYEIIVRSDVPFPSIADAGYLMMVPLVALGVIFFSSEGQRITNSRPTLDGIAFILALLAAVWYLVLEPTYAASDASLLEKGISGAYPVGDVVIAYALAVAMRRQWQARARNVLLMLLAGVLLLIIADVGFAWLQLNGHYSATSLVNVGWPAAFLLIAFAAALAAVWQPTFIHEADMGPVQGWLLPALVLLPAMAVLDFVSWQGEGWSMKLPLLAMTATSAAAVLLQQSINSGLFEDFERSRASMLSWLDDHKRAA